MRKLVLLIIMSCALGLASPAMAQDDKIDTSKCDMNTMNQILKLYADSIQKVIDNKPTDPIKVSDFLQATSTLANQMRATCDGLVFSGKKQQVIGPVTIPEGIYRAIATTTKYMIVHVDTTDGECGVGTRMSSSSLFNLSEGDGTDGAEAVFSSKGCTALISVENTRADWQLTFERITTQ